MNRLVLTLMFDGKFYSALLQRDNDKMTALAKHIFGAEPSDAELYEFTLKELKDLKFTDPVDMAENLVARCKISFKRMQRQVKKEMRESNLKKETHSQEEMRLKLEKGAKLAKRKVSREQRDQDKKDEFALKQKKKKKKLKGH